MENLDCEQKYVRTDDVSFHKFPREEELLNQWKLFTGRDENWQPSRWSAICSRHFKERDYRKYATRKILKRNAIPSVIRFQNGNSGIAILDENQAQSTSKENDEKTIENCEIAENKTFKVDSQESKVIAFQHHLESGSANLLSMREAENLSLNTESDILSIPLDIPECIGSQNLEPCNILQHEIVNNDVQQYEMNTSGTSSLLNFYESTTAPCRLCGQEDHITNSFLNDFEIFGMIQKCMPTLNIRQNDIFSKEVCSNCLEQLENFNAFIDQVILHQKNLMENVQTVKQMGKHPTVISSVKIKQEPISNMKMNIKQEILDTHSTQHPEGMLEDHSNNFNSEHIHDHEETFAMEPATEDQKFYLRESNPLTTREIVKNCDIIEIINLEDGYIDIPDDEMDDSQNSIEQRITKDGHPKVIHNKEIRIKKKMIEDVEPFPKEHITQPCLIQNVIDEHNYTRNCAVLIDPILKVNEYKQEEPEDQVIDEINNGINGKEYDQIESNCIIHKIETTNSPKKIVPKKEKLSDKLNLALRCIENQTSNDKKVVESIQIVNQKNDFDVSSDNHQMKITNTEKTQNESNFTFDFVNHLFFSEEDGIKSNTVRSKNSNKSSIVVINESILKPGDIKHFELRKCLECNLQFFSFDSFNEHQKLHHSTSSFDEIKTAEAICTHFCVLCESNFDSFYELLRHRSKCRIQNQFSAKKPKKSFKNIYNCPMCLKIFTSKLALNNHRKYICKYPQNGNKFNCKYCDENFKKWIICRHHEKLCRARKNKITYTKEDSTERRRKELLKSKKQSSQEKSNLNLLSTEQENFEGRYNCETCNRSYTRYQNLVRHKKVHRPKTEWNYKCGSCDKRFDRMYDLKTHLKLAECPCVPSKPDTIFFVCQTCGKRFKTMQILKEHGVTHSQLLPYICQICNKSFKALRNLRQHKITHTDLKTIQCDLCDKTFKRLNGLLQHKRGYHLKIKPHVCGVCKHAYALKGDMLRCKHKYLNAH